MRNMATKKRFFAGVLPLAGILAALLSACPTTTNPKPPGQVPQNISKGTITPVGKGNFDISPNKAAAGAAVTLTLRDIDSEYEFLSWNCVPSSVVPVETSIGSGIYTFTMPPDTNVIVNVTFSPKNAQKFNINKGTVTPAGKGNFDISHTEAALNATITLTPRDIDSEYEFGSWNCVPGSVVPVETSAGSGVYTFSMPGQEVTVYAVFTKKPLAPAARSADFAFKKMAYSSGQSEWNPLAVLENITDGNPGTQHQLQGIPGQIYFGVNLGEEKNIGTVRITWGISDYGESSGLPEPICNYEIRVGPSAFVGIPAAASISQWTNVLSVNNTARKGVEILTLPEGIRGQWVAIIRQAGYFDGNGEFTDWPRLSMLEVYERGAPELIHDKGAITISAPVYGGDALNIGDDFAASGNYSAKLASISPEPPAGKYTHSHAYTFTINLISDDYYRFTSIPPVINGAVGHVVSNDGLTMTVAYTFPAIPVGGIEVAVPVFNVPAAPMGGNYAADGSSFTAAISGYGGALDGANYKAGVAYAFEWTLTATGLFTFSEEPLTITVNGIPGIYTYVNSSTARVTYTFPIIPYPETPGAVDLAFGKGGTAVASSVNTWAVEGSLPSLAFDGNPATNWQAMGSADSHWVGVDLGAVNNLGTVKITWGVDGNYNPDPMVNGVIQIANIKPASMTANGANSTNTSYDDTGWISAVEFRNTIRSNRITIVTLPAGTTGRCLRVKAAPPLSNAEGVWTEWPRISMIEIYETGPVPAGLQDITAVMRIDLPAPVKFAAAPAIGSAYTPVPGVSNSADWTARLTDISPVPELSTFAPSTAYTYTFEFKANANYRFGLNNAPYVNGSAMGNRTTILSSDRYTMIAAYAFNATTAATPGIVDIVVKAETDFSGFPADITLYKIPGEGKLTTMNISLTQYTSAEWYVDGELKTTGGSYILNAAALTEGPHSLTMIVTVNGHWYSKLIDFMVRP